VDSLCTIDRYRRAVGQAALLIQGRQDELAGSLRDEMLEAADAQEYERAGHLRDAVRTVETLRDRHNKLEAPAFGDRDAFGVKIGPAGAVVQIFQMRRGRVHDRVELVAEGDAGPGASGGQADDDDPVPGLLASALPQFYAERAAPPEVHLPAAIGEEDRQTIEAWLAAEAGRRVRLIVPQRGEKRGLVDLAMRNAAMAYQSHFSEGASAAYEALDELRVLLNLPALPRRVECFDISTLQGRDTVAAMVVAVEGRMRRGEYRRYRIRGDAGASSVREALPDDFAAMREVVLRRYRRQIDQGGPFPDLVLIDGGKGQVSAAYAALAELGLEGLLVVGLAKQEELLFTRDRAEGLALPPESPARRLLQRVRDEAHRFAVTFHRRRRSARTLRSALDEVAGIGARRRKQLLTTFGSVAGVRRASRAELERVVGPRAADAVIRHFGPR
jgi:excinuclease ABC subunit C